MGNDRKCPKISVLDDYRIRVEGVLGAPFIVGFPRRFLRRLGVQSVRDMRYDCRRRRLYFDDGAYITWRTFRKAISKAQRLMIDTGRSGTLVFAYDTPWYSSMSRMTVLAIVRIGDLRWHAHFLDGSQGEVYLTSEDVERLGKLSPVFSADLLEDYAEPDKLWFFRWKDIPANYKRYIGADPFPDGEYWLIGTDTEGLYYSLHLYGGHIQICGVLEDAPVIKDGWYPGKPWEPEDLYA